MLVGMAPKEVIIMANDYYTITNEYTKLTAKVCHNGLNFYVEVRRPNGELVRKSMPRKDLAAATFAADKMAQLTHPTSKY